MAQWMEGAVRGKPAEARPVLVWAGLEAARGLSGTGAGGGCWAVMWWGGEVTAEYPALPLDVAQFSKDFV